ncbi:MAG: DUF3990 domain-containing protein [Alistipes sp.]|jgi:hypothetical protein|nr:DUF3990 domain-containing protein [Alistipes sp.]
MTTVYHGSYTPIERVDLVYSEKSGDFGRGFYVTSLREQAEIWATRIGGYRHVEGVVTEFEYEEYTTREMKMEVLRFDGYTDEWLDFVVLNRNNKSDEQVHDYDIVEGPVADDRVSTRVDEFIAGAISREQFMSDLVYNPSHQMCFCTVLSLEAITPILPKRRIEIGMYRIGDEVMQELMREYGVSEMEATDLYHTSATYAAVSDESTGLYQKPWREIYEMLISELGNDV